MDKQSVAFDLDYLAYRYDEFNRELWWMEWRTERVYMVRILPSIIDPVGDFVVRRLSNDEPLGAGETKADACSAAYYRLMNETYREGAPKAYGTTSARH